MKQIMLDHLRRWKWALATILIGYSMLQVFAVLEYSPRTDPMVAPIFRATDLIHNTIAFQVIMWLGFLLLWDMSRGLPRILANMPVTIQQVGRAWWLVAVAFPALALGTIGCLAILIFSGGPNTTALFKNYLFDWSEAALYLGAEFGAMTFMVLPTSGAFTNQVFTVLPRSLFVLVPMGFIFLPMSGLPRPIVTLIFAGYVILFVLGCFRAKDIVLQRFISRPASNCLKKQRMQYKIPKGLGGLPYLARKTFVQTSLIGLIIIIWMTASMTFLSHGQNRSQAIGSMMDAGSVPYAFVILGSIIPVAFQLRLLRALPISASTLSAMLVLLPVCSIAVIGVIVVVMANAAAGRDAIQTPANDFLFLGAKAALMVPLVVWRGLDAGTYILAFLLVACGSLASLTLALSFHLTKMPEQPLWLTLSIFFISTIGSILLTRRLLTKSSHPYRARVLPTNLWNMARR